MRRADGEDLRVGPGWTGHFDPRGEWMSAWRRPCLGSRRTWPSRDEAEGVQGQTLLSLWMSRSQAPPARPLSWSVCACHRVCGNGGPARAVSVTASQHAVRTPGSSRLNAKGRVWRDAHHAHMCSGVLACARDARVPRGARVSPALCPGSGFITTTKAPIVPTNTYISLKRIVAPKTALPHPFFSEESYLF